MPHVEIDVAELMAIWLGGVLVLLPVLGLIARWAVVPLIDALARYRAAASGGAALQELGERFARQEARLAELARAVEHLEAGARSF